MDTFDVLTAISKKKKTFMHMVSMKIKPCESRI